MPDMNLPLRKALRAAYTGPTGAARRTGCPNSARLKVGALTEFERDHIRTCLWCQEKLVSALPPRRPWLARHWARSVGVLALSFGLGLISAWSWNRAEKHLSGYSGRVNTASTPAVNPAAAGSIDGTSLVETFGRKRNTGEALRSVDESEIALRQVFSIDQMTLWKKHELDLAKVIGDPCYFDQLVQARQTAAETRGRTQADLILLESAKQVERVKRVGVKQELLNMRWDPVKVQGCAVLANKANLRQHRLGRSRALRKADNAFKGEAKAHPGLPLPQSGGPTPKVATMGHGLILRRHSSTSQ